LSAALVAAEPHHEVAGAHAVSEAVRDELKQPVARRVPESVVDLFEPVQVEQEQPDPLLNLALLVPPRHRPALGPMTRLGERLLGAEDQQLAVGQAGEAIVHGLVLAAQRYRRVDVDRDERQHEQGHERRRPAHGDHDERREPEQRAVDEQLEGEVPAHGLEDRSAFVQCDSRIDQG